MKFYYNGQLVRTSKNHEYRYAIINAEGKVLGCSSTRENAQKEINAGVSEIEQNIANSREALKSIEAGKKGFYAKYGRKTTFVKFTYQTKEMIEKNLADQIKWLETYKASRKIVELEARA